MIRSLLLKGYQRAFCLMVTVVAGATVWGEELAGGAFPNTSVGVGSGPVTPFKLERPAPAGALLSDGGWADAPAITLTGNWAIFVATKTPPRTVRNLSGTVLSIGVPSDSIFTDSGQMAITWCASFDPKTWGGGMFGGTFVVTAKDDQGLSASARKPNVPFFGKTGVQPLVGRGNMNDGKTHGLVVQCRNGVVEFWEVDQAGARLMDRSAVNTVFKGITGKPIRIGAAALAEQKPPTAWKAPVQGLVVYHGSCLSPYQMSRLFNGADARDVLTLSAQNDDRYYPGTSVADSFTELVSNKNGVIDNAIITPAILPETVSDDVTVELDGEGQVLPRDPAPASSTKVRFWGTRAGDATDIRMRIVKADAPDPVGPTDVIVDWNLVATNAKNGQTWIGEIPNVPHAFADYDCEVSWKDQKGRWTEPKRLNRRWCLGIVVSIGGQSILQRMRDDSARPPRSYDAAVGNYLRGFYDAAQGTAGFQDQTQTQGWTSRKTVNATSFYGELLMAERLAMLAKAPVGVGNFAIGGSPISAFLGQSERWSRWKDFIQRCRPQIGIWGNGQGDLGLSKEKRFTALDQLLTQFDEAVRTAPGGPWKYRFYVYPMNGDWNNNGDAIRSYDYEWALSRSAQGKPVGILCFTLDAVTQDGTHLADNEAGLGALASRMAQTLACSFGSVSSSGLGPEVEQANCRWNVANGVTTVKLAFSQNGGTGLVTASGAGAPSGFKLSIDGGPFIAPDTTAIADPTHIVLTSTMAATSRVSVTYQAGYPGAVHLGAKTTPEEAGLDGALYDNRGDAITGLPGFPVCPITGAAPLVLTK